jgi:hypothetical protein
MKRQAEIELEYSKSIQKLVKQQKEDILKKSQDKSAAPFYEGFQGG